MTADSTKPMQRPALVKDEHLEHLDELRDAGKINMFHAPLHLAKKFDLDARTAGVITSYWARTNQQRTR